MCIRDRIAIIGYGDSGRGIHARLLREIGEEVSAVVTRSPERSAEAVTDWPAAEVFASIGGGMDVDGDNPDDVQRGFLALRGLPTSAERARDTFGNRRVGEFLIDVLRGAADGRPDRDPTGDYYAALQEVS